MRTYEGSYGAADLRVAIVAARFNETVVKQLLEGALGCLRRHGVPEDDITVAWVPGAFELPLVVKRLAASGEFDAIVALGAVIRGETPHFEYVSAHATSGIGQASLETGVPVGLGVLTTEDTEQAMARAGGKAGNKGFEAAMAALELAGLFAALPKPTTEL